MIRPSSFAILVFFASLSFSSMSLEVDSTEDSSIRFLTLEATLSSKIVHFKWQVDFEAKGDYFIIEKSIDEENWTEVQRVQSMGDYNERHTYEVSEINFAEGPLEYFRILRVDDYGQITEMDRTNINQPILTNMLLIPVAHKVNKELTVSYDSMISSERKMYIYNQFGEIIIEKLLNKSEGYNRVTLNIKPLPEGKYLIVIEDEFGNKMSKSLVMHGYKGRRKH